MKSEHLGGRVILHHGDSRDVLKALPDNSIDSVVTDPPYALVSIVKRFGGENAAPAQGDVYARASAGFMGKTWDTGETAFAVEFWAEVMRVLKPGGHVIAASGTRTYHRLAVAIEDAGFEIRDMSQWLYASGFPKSHNIVKKLQESGRACTCHKTIVSHHHVCDENLRDLQRGMDALDALPSGEEPDVQPCVLGEGNISQEGRDRAAPVATAGHGAGVVHRVRGDVLAKCEAHRTSGAAHVLVEMQRGASRGGVGDSRPQGAEGSDAGKLCVRGDENGSEPGLEGRGDAQAAARQLQGGSLCPGAGMGAADGAQGRLCDGASPDNGEAVRLPAHAAGGGAPCGSQPGEQSPEQFGALADERASQAWGGWPVCPGCRKPVVPEGYGTALKPACEPWALARKPLSGTVAANVLAHGTGALNIDGARIPTDEVFIAPKSDPANREGVVGKAMQATGGADRNNAAQAASIAALMEKGRWPANVIHDGSDEVVGAFLSTTSTPPGNIKPSPTTANAYGEFAARSLVGHNDSGSAARFFYSAKADALDRIGSKHPTVKPVDLMQYFVRLVTPPGGVVLDPFAGSGTTGEAAWREGFRAILIEREEEYAADIRERLRLAECGEGTKRRAIAAKKAKPVKDDGLQTGLFA